MRLVMLLCAACIALPAHAEIVRVLHPQGAAHGFVEVTTSAISCKVYAAAW
jgi:hypothetical protein